MDREHQDIEQDCNAHTWIIGIDAYLDEGDGLTKQTCHEEASTGWLDIAIGNLEANLCSIRMGGYSVG